MKNLLHLSAALLIGFSAIAQIELKSNGKKVEKLTCGMNQVDLRVYLPKEAKNFDIIDVQLHRHTDEKMEKITFETEVIPGRGNLCFSNVYYKEAFSAWEYIDYKLIDGESSDIMLGSLYYSLDEVCKYPKRNFEKTYNKIRIVGGVHKGWTYENGEKVKTYDFSTIKEYSFVHEIGAVDPNSYNSSFEIGMARLTLEGLYEDLNGDDNSLNYTLHSSEEAEESFDFGAEPSENVSNSIFIKLLSSKELDLNTIKKSIEQQIIISTNYYYSFSDVEIVFPFNLTNDQNIVYEGAVAKGNKAKSTAESMIKDPTPYFVWSKKTYNGEEYSVLEIPVYDQKQTKLNSAKSSEVKSEEKENTKIYRVLLKEKNGVVYVAGIAQTGSSKLTANAKTLIENFEKSITIK